MHEEKSMKEKGKFSRKLDRKYYNTLPPFSIISLCHNCNETRLVSPETICKLPQEFPNNLRPRILESPNTV